MSFSSLPALWAGLCLLILAAPLQGANTLQLSPVEAQVIEELNYVRTEPARYAREVLIPMRAYYQGLDIVDPPWFSPVPNRIQVVVTKEGRPALEEAIQALLAAQPAGPLQPSYGLTLSARSHREAQARERSIGHIGSNGSTPEERIRAQGEWNIAVGENLFYGDAQRMVARHAVMSLLIDDGVADRGHRNVILDHRYRWVGVAYGPHPLYGHMLVQNFAAEFRDHAP
ncbi:CAP domain-containing protein [Ferrimonas gelatinilytica]|uniref:CAP domain-containing protein n=1 Tax=Ferrimonas gelatinilytica TaxID=1255257 RepID=A0ABP9RUX9_9GAMM